MRFRLLLGLLTCCLAFCHERYSERVVYCVSVRDAPIQRMLQVCAEMGDALETDNRYPGSAATSNGLRDSFILGSKRPLKIMSATRREQAETAADVRVFQTGARLSREELDGIRDDVISRFEQKMRGK